MNANGTGNKVIKAGYVLAVNLFTLLSVLAFRFFLD
jgi:hypothetical protein